MREKGRKEVSLGLHACSKWWFGIAMVAVVAATGFCYGGWHVVKSTRGLQGESERSFRMLSFIFSPRVAGYTWFILNMFWRKGRVAINDGDHHGEAVIGLSLYGDSHRLMYCT